MKDIVAYLNWISYEVRNIKNIPWLGIKFLKNDHKPNIEEGKKVYKTYCAVCHGNNGEGGAALASTQGKTVPAWDGERIGAREHAGRYTAAALWASRMS